MAEWSRLATSTISKYVKGYTPEIFRQRALLALLKSKGRVDTGGASGTDIKWQVEYRQTPIHTNNHESAQTFARQDYLKQCSLSWKGYSVEDAISDRELKINSGKEALVRLIDNMGRRLTESMEASLPTKLLGSSASDSEQYDGLETIFGTPTQTVTQGTAGAVARSANAADIVAYPVVSNYAGLSTVLGAYGGSGPTAGTWPNGVVSQPAFDFFSPIMVHYDSTAFGGASNDWAQQCVSALRFGITHAKRNKSQKGALDLIMLDRELFRQFKEKHDPLQRIPVSANNRMASLGFTDTMMLDGVEIMSDYDVPSGVGYGLNADFMTLHSAGELLELKGPYYDEESQSTRYMLRTFGNLQLDSPRHFVKWGDFV